MCSKKLLLVFKVFAAESGRRRKEGKMKQEYYDGINSYILVGDRPFRVYDEIPEGWSVIENATTAPCGYVWIAENKSRFVHERKRAFIRNAFSLWQHLGGKNE